MKQFYHGSCTKAGIKNVLLPPILSNTISEKGRNKNLDKIFFTEDIGLAKIYAGRAAKSIGGEPIILKVINPKNLKQMDSRKGATIWTATEANCEIYSELFS